MGGTILEYSGIGKSFSTVRVLENVSLTLEQGEVLGLVGENGAGKSTMMNILGGIVHADEGKMTLFGSDYKPTNPSDASASGIAFIQQELSLFTNLSVGENLFIDKLPRTKVIRRVDVRAIASQSKAFLDRLDPDLSPNALVENLSMGRRQLVEVAKALAKRAKIIIFDEPTSSLSNNEKTNLFRVITELRAEGTSIIYISHILEDVFELCDRIMVIRDGKVVGCDRKGNLTKDMVVKMMVGRELKEFYPYKQRTIGNPLLEVRGLCSGNRLSDVSFSVHEKEIVGFFGVVGAGRTELARAIFGVDPIDSGEVMLYGRELRGCSTRERVQRGMAFITENRKDEGLLLSKNVADNLVLASLEEMLKRLRIVDEKLSDRIISQVIQDVNIKTHDKNRQLARNLSGGNQQKVVFGKWVIRKPKLFILDEPTRGVDVGAKYEIYNIINELAEMRTGVIMISSEMGELMGMCDRILVMCNGRITGAIERKDFSQEKIIQAAVGGGK